MSGPVRGILPEVRKCLGDSPVGPKLVGRPSRTFRSG